MLITLKLLIESFYNRSKLISQSEQNKYHNKTEKPNKK